MGDFKRGDKVRCVDPHDRPTLQEGGVYEVESEYGVFLGDQFLYLAGHPDPLPYRADRFEHAP